MTPVSTHRVQIGCEWSTRIPGGSQYRTIPVKEMRERERERDGNGTAVVSRNREFRDAAGGSRAGRFRERRRVPDVPRSRGRDNYNSVRRAQQVRSKIHPTALFACEIKIGVS